VAATLLAAIGSSNASKPALTNLIIVIVLRD